MAKKKAKRRLAKKLLLHLREVVPPTGTKGPLELTPFRPTRKDKKNKGRYTPKIIKPQMPFKEVYDEALEPEIEFDPWLSYNDGFRDPERRIMQDKIQAEKDMRKARLAKKKLLYS